MSAPEHVERLRGLLALPSGASRRLISVPGCWDGLSALLIERAGFDVAFVTGGGLSAARLGRPDVGLLTAAEVTESVASIRSRVAQPLIVDADTGFGNVLNARRAVHDLERAGASAIQIEDQVFPKRCGHLAGKQVVGVSEAADKIAAAVDARDHALIVARTDALAIEGLDAALDRAEAYLAAGADALFIEGPRDMAELAAVAARFAARVPLVHNLVEGGITPTDSGDDLEALGFAIALHPLVLMHGLIAQAPFWLESLRTTRSTAGLRGSIASLQDLNALTGLRELLALADGASEASAG